MQLLERVDDTIANGTFEQIEALVGNMLTMQTLAEALAAHNGATFSDVMAALRNLPGNLAPLLASPQGLTLLGHVVATTLPSPNPDFFVPTRH